MTLFEERLERTMSAVALKPVDRVPFSYIGNAVNAQFVGVPLSKYCTDLDVNLETNLKGIEMVGGVDSTQNTIFLPNNLEATWFTKALIPGRDLPDNELWQMHEKEVVTEDDYDEILEGGYGPWVEKFLKERMGDPRGVAAEMGFPEKSVEALRIFEDANIPCINSRSFSPPFEAFCGGRTLMTMFMDDMMEIPEKLDKVFKAAFEFTMETLHAVCSNPATRPLGVWVGGWRGTPGMLNLEMFERYSWNYMRPIVEELVSYGVVPILHLDSNWDNGFEYFLQLPKGKAIMALDGQSDIRKAKQVVGDHMCIMGDVPASLLAMSSADKVTEYCKALIKDIGPTGFILCSGCDIPYNAKLENVQAMVRSVQL